MSSSAVCFWPCVMIISMSEPLACAICRKNTYCRYEIESTTVTKAAISSTVETPIL